MVICDNCPTPITGQYFYNREVNDNKKFCSSYCLDEYYGRKCDKCGKVQNMLIEKDGKKFCSSACMNSYFGEKDKEQLSDFWKNYKGLIIGGGIILVLIIVLGIVFSVRKRGRR